MLEILPSDVRFWIVLACLVAAVVVLVGWLGVRRSGGRTNLRIFRNGIELEAGGGEPERTVVAEEAVLKGARAGNIVGRRVRGRQEAPAGGNVEVARGLRAQNSDLGDIVGVELDGRDDSREE